MLVACGTEDEGSQIDNEYALYKKQCNMLGIFALPEFEWINMSIMFNPISLKLPNN